MKKKNNSFSFIYKDRKWNCQILSPEAYESKLKDSNSEALTIYEDSKPGRMFFKSDSISKSLVIHELVHVFLSYHHVDRVSFTNHQMEELFAEMLANEHSKLIALANKIFKALKKFAEEIEDAA